MISHFGRDLTLDLSNHHPIDQDRMNRPSATCSQQILSTTSTSRHLPYPNPSKEEVQRRQRNQDRNDQARRLATQRQVELEKKDLRHEQKLLQDVPSDVPEQPHSVDEEDQEERKQEDGYEQLGVLGQSALLVLLRLCGSSHSRVEHFRWGVFVEDLVSGGEVFVTVVAADGGDAVSGTVVAAHWSDAVALFSLETFVGRLSALLRLKLVT
jgi:hypothetical protein